jgi:F0F1-type ATP synthase assembly protein I
MADNIKIGSRFVRGEEFTAILIILVLLVAIALLDTEAPNAIAE